MRTGSLRTAIETGRWRRLDPGRLGWVAAGAAMLDATTTAHVILSPAYWEGNVVFAAVAAHSPLLGALAFAAFAMSLAGFAWLSLGWLSTLAATTTVVSLGLGGVNNSILFLTGTSLYAHAGLDHTFVIFYAAPTVGALLGLALLTREQGVPWTEVGVVVPLFLLSGWLLPAMA